MAASASEAEGARTACCRANGPAGGLLARPTGPGRVLEEHDQAQCSKSRRVRPPPPRNSSRRFQGRRHLGLAELVHAYQLVIAIVHEEKGSPSPAGPF